MTLLLRRVARHVLDVVGHGWELATDALARLEAELELHRAWGYTGRVQGCEQWQGPQSLNGGRPLPYAGRYSSPACCTCTSGVICSLPALVPSRASRVRGRGRSRRTSGHCTFKRRAAPVLVYYLVIADVNIIDCSCHTFSQAEPVAQELRLKYAITACRMPYPLDASTPGPCVKSS